jgi:hypothetical protein
MAPLPTPVRAALGLAANAVEAARTLPDRVVELPVLAVSTALQISLRAQQRYTELALRGDELIGRLHAPPEEPPSWATFDDEVPPASARPAEPSHDHSASAVAAKSTKPVTDAPADIPISTPADEPAAPVKSATKQPRARKKTAAAAKTAARTAARSSAAKPVRAPRQTKPSAFDRTEE